MLPTGQAQGSGVDVSQNCTALSSLSLCLCLCMCVTVCDCVCVCVHRHWREPIQPSFYPQRRHPLPPDISAAPLLYLDSLPCIPPVYLSIRSSQSLAAGSRGTRPLRAGSLAVDCAGASCNKTLLVTQLSSYYVAIFNIRKDTGHESNLGFILPGQKSGQFVHMKARYYLFFIWIISTYLYARISDLMPASLFFRWGMWGRGRGGRELWLNYHPFVLNVVKIIYPSTVYAYSSTILYVHSIFYETLLHHSQDCKMQSVFACILRGTAACRFKIVCWITFPCPLFISGPLIQDDQQTGEFKWNQ